MASSGIPLDAVAIMSSVLEGILYGGYCNKFACPLHTKLAFFRLFSPHVCSYYLDSHLQTSHTQRQSATCYSCHPTVLTEYRGKRLPACIQWHPLKLPKHMVVGIIRIEDGLVKYRDTFPGGSVAFFADVAQETFVVKDAIIILQTLLGDGVVVGSNFNM
jgi:hypothetical protein